MLVSLLLTGCNRGDHAAHGAAGHDHSAMTGAAQPSTAAKGGDVEHYTCAMHPSVKMQNASDKCPICKMDLTPVTKRKSLAGDDTNHTAHATAALVEIDTARLQQIGIRTAPVRRLEVDRTAEATAIVRYDDARMHDLNVRLDGWVRELFVERTGQWVKAGEPLLTLYSPEWVAVQKEFLAAREVAKQLGDESLLQSARARLRLWDLPEAELLELERTGEVRTNILFTAEHGGFVTEKMVQRGMKVMPGMTLFKVADTSRVWVEADFYESEFPLLKHGAFAELQFDGLPDDLYLGRISYLYPYLNPETRTQRARFDVANPDGALKPGMYARAVIEESLGEHLVVPVDAIMPTGKRSLVFVHHGGGRIEPREVQLGQRTGRDYVVKEGLKEGENVLTSANFLIDAESRLQGALQQFEGGGAAMGGHQH
jgi:membrane fusion protein, copper/silver efflux system